MPALRPKFCQTVERFDAAIRVTRGSETVGGTSIMGLMMLGAATGTTITVEATGKEATAAIEAIDKLVSSGFGEEDSGLSGPFDHIKNSLYPHCTGCMPLL